MRGERVAEGVRAHLCLKARAAGVTLDDLVEALACEARATAVEEQPGALYTPAGRAPDARFERSGEKCRAPTLAVRAKRRHGLAADRHEALLGALPPRPQHALLQIDVRELESDRLRGTQAARVHDLQQGTVA